MTGLDSSRLLRRPAGVVGTLVLGSLPAVLLPAVLDAFTVLRTLPAGTTAATVLSAGTVLVGALVLMAAAVWVAVSVGVCLVAARDHQAHPGRSAFLQPRFVRLVVAAALGMALAPAAADARGSVDGLRLPDRVSGAEALRLTPPTVGPSPDRAGASSHRVRPGDSLWAIAARLLPATASRSEVDQAWRWLYRRNRTVIGPDPELIHPDTTLHIPSRPWS